MINIIQEEEKEGQTREDCEDNNVNTNYSIDS